MEERRQETPVFGRKMYVNHPLVLDRPPTGPHPPAPLADLHIHHRGASASRLLTNIHVEGLEPHTRQSARSRSMMRVVRR
ncbi:hypothetical protein [Frankia sp. Cr1]|uniref:hypothetical protein n=1 Tax=Frankia sp. Cr1 TaxID=3073931 RepID=UPI002AD2AEB2|nr:hypothetical protein [Frankia sp. Cr1]